MGVSRRETRLDDISRIARQKISFFAKFIQIWTKSKFPYGLYLSTFFSSKQGLLDSVKGENSEKIKN